MSSTYAAACPLPAPVGALALARVRRRFLTHSCGWVLCVVAKQVRSLEHSFAQRMNPDRVSNPHGEHAQNVWEIFDSIWDDPRAE